MKRAINYSFRARYISLPLLALFLFTTLQWTWQRNPIRSAQEWYQMPSVFPAEVPIDDTGTTKLEEIREKISIPIRENGTKPNIDVASSAPVESIPAKSPEIQYNLDARSSFQSEVCDYAKGRWVADSRRPLYSGFGCKQWLYPMWSCRRGNRPDFSFEGYRWKPENCDIPEFNRSAFLRKMQDKTIAFIGDSLGRQQFQSLMCMATGGEHSREVEYVGQQYGMVKVKAHGTIRPAALAYRFRNTNTTILYHWSACLCDLEPLNITDKLTNVAMHLDQPLAFMRRYLDRFDVLVINTGHHWNQGKFTENRWVMHVDGKPNKDKRIADIESAKNFTIYSAVRWLDLQLGSHPRLKAFFRTISPRHFMSGDWNTGGRCDNTIPLTNGSEVKHEGSIDQTIESALKGTKIKILDITAISQLRDEGHVSRYTRRTRKSSDCLHWCLPGIPDTWNELLVAQI